MMTTLVVVDIHVSICKYLQFQFQYPSMFGISMFLCDGVIVNIIFNFKDKGHHHKCTNFGYLLNHIGICFNC